MINDAGVGLRHRLRLENVRADQDRGEVEGVDAVVDVGGHVPRVAEGVLGGGGGHVTLEHHPGAPLLAVVAPGVAGPAPCVLYHHLPALFQPGRGLCFAQTLVTVPVVSAGAVGAAGGAVDVRRHKGAADVEDKTPACWGQCS